MDDLERQGKRDRSQRMLNSYSRIAHSYNMNELFIQN